MADDPLPGQDDAPSVSDVAGAVVDKVFTTAHGKSLEALIGNAISGAEKTVVGGMWEAVGGTVRLFLKAVFGLIEAGDPILDDIAKVAVDAVLGDGAKRGHMPDDVGRHILEKLAPAGGAVEPGLEGAQRYLTTITHLQFETWLLGLTAEVVADAADIVRGSGATLQSVAELREIVTQVFGGGRITRRVLAPFIDDGIVTPAKWATAKQYRPTLLSPADAIRQFKRGNWDFTKLEEELARQGFSSERIDALVNAQDKFFSPGDVRFLVEREQWTSDQAIQHLVDQGYDREMIADLLRIEGLKLFESHESTEASVIIGSYASRDIERPQFLDLLSTYIEPKARRALYEELGELRRTLFIKHLTSSQAAACVKAGVLAYRDYREALAREGYDADAATALELLLRFEIDKQHTIDEHRKALEDEKAAVKAQRDADAAARKAQVEADRALKRRGPLADLERAAVRGLIPFARVEEVLGAEYDADTVDILVGIMEDDRQTYLAQQAAAEKARERAARRDVDVGTLEQAVLDNLLTIQEFEARLAMLKFDPADAALLAGILQAKKKDQADAKAKRDAADAAAKIKHIDLGRLERLVRLGARPVGDYDAQLRALGFDDASRAQMGELLQVEIARDRKADQARADAEAKLKNRGLSLEEFRRAVILGVKTVDQYNTFLVTQGFTADAVATLVADVRLAVADADAARRKRSGAGSGSGAPALSLSTASRAARLGIITPAVYRARLVHDGYSADDVAIEMELLATEITDVQAQRAKRDLLEEQTADRGLSLTQVEKAVKAGIASIEDYRSRAASLNYGADDVELLVALLEEELAAKQAAKAAKDAAAPAGTDQATAIAALEDAVRAGEKTLYDYRAALGQLGLSADDVALLAGNLADDLGIIQ